MYLIVSGTLQYTYGIFSLSEGKEKITSKSALTNPGILDTVTGLILYLFQFHLPEVVFNSLDTIPGLSSPLGMILLGGYLARSHFIVLWLLPIDDPTILLTLAIVNSTPTAVNTAVFSQIYGGDYEYGARLVILSSIFSMITIPLLITTVMNLF